MMGGAAWAEGQGCSIRPSGSTRYECAGRHPPPFFPRLGQVDCGDMGAFTLQVRGHAVQGLTDFALRHHIVVEHDVYSRPFSAM